VSHSKNTKVTKIPSLVDSVLLKTITKNNHLFFFFFLIIKNKALLNNKKLYNKAHNPTKRETEPYIEGSKSDIRYGPKPYKVGSNTVQQKYNTKLNNNITTAQQQQQQTTQLQQHQTTQILTTIQKITRATTTNNVRNSRRFGALIPAKQTTEKSNQVGHGKKCHAIQVW
jgi:hypothetical protein